MTIITVYNKKGGVAKTTTALSMGAYLADFKGKRVLLIDVDGQCDLTRQSNKEVKSPSSYDVILGQCKIYEAIRIIKTATDKDGKKYVSLAIIGADPRLAALDTALANAPDGSVKLRRAFSAYPELEKSFDYVIIDCPPSLGRHYLNALSVSDYLLITAFPEEASTNAIKELIDPIKTTQEVINPELKIAGVLRTRVKTFGKNTSQLFRYEEKKMLELSEELGCCLFKTFIRDSLSVSECQEKRMTIFDYASKYAPTSTAAEDYKKFMEEFLGTIKEV